MAGEMSTWVCEDSDVVELVNAGMHAWASYAVHGVPSEAEWARLRAALEAIPIPEEEA